MASTSSVQAPCDAECDYIDSMVTRLADPDYIEPQVSMQIFTEGNHQPAPPIQDDSKDQYWKYMELYRAAMEGDWEKAKKFFDENQVPVTAKINSNLENALHVAVQAGGKKAIDFVKNLVEEMPIEALKHQNKFGQTVLIYAAIAGNMRAAVILVRKHPLLLYIPDKYELLPVHVAAQHGRKDTFQYLLSVTQDENDGVIRPFAGKSGVRLVRQVIFSGYYGEALKLIDRYPELAKLQLPNGDSVLSAIALMESAFNSESHLSPCENAIYYLSQRLQAMLYKVLAFLEPRIERERKQVHHQAVQLVKLLCQQIATLSDYKAYESIVKGPLLSATELGVKEVVEEIFDLFPDAVWFTDDESRSVFELAILHRQEKVFNIIHKMDPCRRLLSNHLDSEGNNVLHLVARLPPRNKLNHIPTALQMQCELQWFKEVENLVPPKNRLKRNNDGQTPAELFTKAHKDLVREGEKWMKGTANSSAIVASLIATIAFAAAITGPGGNYDDSGLPIFSKKNAFIIFAISNALSLFTSATSLLMFLSILTSQYKENDFLEVIPGRLIIYLYTLFVSISSMLVAFTATLYLVLGKYKARILIPTAVLASFPIYFLTSWQFPLIENLVYSTYGTIFARKNYRWIGFWKSD